MEMQPLDNFMKKSKGFFLAGSLFTFCCVLPCANGGLQFTTLFAFNRTNGVSPEEFAQGADGALYGTASGGGIGFNGGGSGNGTVFELSTNGAFTSFAFVQLGFVRF